MKVRALDFELSDRIAAYYSNKMPAYTVGEAGRSIEFKRKLTA